MPNTQSRRGGFQDTRFIVMSADPPADPNFVLVYARLVDGVYRTLARFPSGSIIVIL